MAKFAYKEAGKLPAINAESLRLNQRGTYYCTTPGCTATMHTRDLAKTSACFVSDDKKEHINPRICLKKDNFKPDKYAENLFDCNELFERMLNPTERDRNSDAGDGGLGNNRLLPIRTIKCLYEMCLQYRDGGKYNGFDINKILVDDQNYNQYQYGIEGYKIVCCTFRRYDNSKQIIIMNYGEKQISIHIEDINMYIKSRNKLYDKTHENIVVIGGDWKLSDKTNILSECELFSIGKQVCQG